MKFYLPRALTGAALLLVFLVSCTSSTQSPAVVVPTALPATVAPSVTAAVPDTGANTATVPAVSTSTAADTPAASLATATSSATAAPAAAAPSCTSPAAVTPPMTEGPYFKAGSPERTDLYEAGIPGTKLTLTGYVLDTSCQPVAGALVDFWQADGQGQYDNNGYTLRGHQTTDANGRYQLITVVPGLYPGRTEHIHVKVQAPGGRVLTTQLFFPDVAQNQQDSIFDQRLLVTMQQGADGVQAEYTFIVNK